MIYEYLEPHCRPLHYTAIPVPLTGDAGHHAAHAGRRDAAVRARHAGSPQLCSLEIETLAPCELYKPLLSDCIDPQLLLAAPPAP